MGLFSWLFGSSKSRTSNQVSDTIQRQDSPGVSWGTSERGNLTMPFRGGFVTVFSQDDEWKFAAPLPAEVRRQLGEETYFSPPFETQEQAKACAEAYMRDAPWPYLDKITKRERNRAATTIEIMPGLISSELSKLADLRASLDRQRNAKKPKRSVIENLRKKVIHRHGIACHIRSQAVRAGSERYFDEAEKIPKAYEQLLLEVDATISGLPE